MLIFIRIRGKCRRPTRLQFQSILGGFSSRDGRQELLEETVVDAGPLQVHQVACLAYALQHRLLAELPENADPEMFQSSSLIYDVRAVCLVE
mgnify:CR=1 FL=1